MGSLYPTLLVLVFAIGFWRVGDGEANPRPDPLPDPRGFTEDPLLTEEKFREKGRQT